MSTSEPTIDSESNGVLYNVELENDSDSGYDCVQMDELYDGNQQSNDVPVDAVKSPVREVSTAVEEFSEDYRNKDEIVTSQTLDSTEVSGAVDFEKTPEQQIKVQELSKILDAFSVHSDGDDTKKENEDFDGGTVSVEMMYNLAKSVHNLKDEDTLDHSFASSNFLGKEIERNEKRNALQMFSKSCPNNYSKVGNLLGISSVIIPEGEPKIPIENDAKNLVEPLVQQNIVNNDSSKDDVAQSTITILSSVHGIIENDSSESKSDSNTKNSFEVSTSIISESPIRYVTPHKKIYIFFLCLFLIVIYCFIEKVFQMNMAMAHLELMHNKKVLILLKEREHVRAELQQQIVELSEENKALKKFKILSESEKISKKELSNGICPSISKFEPNNLLIFEADEPDEGYQMGFKSCWGEMEVSYKIGQCSSNLQDFVCQSVSNTIDTFNSYVYGTTPSTDQQKVAKPNAARNLNSSLTTSIAFLVGNETYNFSTLMFKIATEPIKTTKNVLQNVIDLAKDSFYEDRL